MNALFTPDCLDLRMTQDSNMRAFLVSENGLIIINRFGIHLYHIPEPGTADDDSDLIPVWSWEGDTSNERGTLYETGSPYPALCLQGYRTTHTLEFDVDESRAGSFPMVVNHHIAEERPDYFMPHHLKLKGRKAMGVLATHSKVVFKTGGLGRSDLARRLDARLPGFYEYSQLGQYSEVKYVDLDEATGRIMVVIGAAVDGDSGDDFTPYARRLCLADLPI